MVPCPALTASDDTETPVSEDSQPAANRLRLLAPGLPALVLILVCIWEIVVIARAGNDVGSDKDWRDAAAAVRAKHAPGDLITFAPNWVDPTGRLHLGDLINLDMAGRMDGDRYGVIWEVSVRGARARETRGLDATATERFGAVTVRRFERQPAVVLSDLTKLARTAARKGSVTPVFTEVGFEPHHCVQMTPSVSAPRKVVSLKAGPTKVEVRRRDAQLTYRKLKLGSKLVGYVGISDVFTRRDFRSPGQLRILIDDKEVLSKRVGVRDGWMRFSIDTTPSDAATVTVIASVDGDKAGRRQVCFAAEARK